jgi:peroxiredoxin Q/BCP
MVAEGEKAPGFELDGSDGKRHSLKEFVGRYLIIYFYPRDNTPGCTIEAREYNKHLGEIRKLDADVVGVSNDDLKSHGKFKDKLDLEFTLLSDPKSETIKAYDSWGDRGIFGVGTIRNTFIVDKRGKIAKVFRKVSPDAHVKEVISFLQNAK